MVVGRPGTPPLAMARQVTKPLVVVPPVPRDPPPAGLHRVLVPLEVRAWASGTETE